MSLKRAALVATIFTAGMLNVGCENWHSDGREAVGALLVSDTTLVRQLFDLPYTPEGTENTGIPLYASEPQITDFTLTPGPTDLARVATFRVRVTAGPGLSTPGVVPPAHATVIARMRVSLDRDSQRQWMYIFPQLSRTVRTHGWDILERRPAP